MKLIKLYILLSLIVIGCSQKQVAFKSKVVYQSETLVITQVAKNSFKHVSYKKTNDFGNVPCNGLIVTNSNEAIVFDTPTTDAISEELIKWITETIHHKINALVPTHFHDDCLGGLKAFNNHAIPSYGYAKTIALAKENMYEVPNNSFSDTLVLKVGNEPVTIAYFGEGHTKDNVVGYFANDAILFGGCLVKELDASKGYLGDANVQEWSATVAKVKNTYPDAQIIVPGHGEHGDKKLLDYTISLFKIK